MKTKVKSNANATIIIQNFIDINRKFSDLEKTMDLFNIKIQDVYIWERIKERINSLKRNLH